MLKFMTLVVAVFYSTLAAKADDRSKSKDGPLAVEIADDLTLNDVVRGKALPLKIYFPKTGGPYPVILFSHGFGGNKDAFGPISKHWTSHGYVVIHPTHADGIGRQNNHRNDDGDHRLADRVGFEGLLGRLSDSATIGYRVADLVLILDNLDKLPKIAPGLQGKIDIKSIGVAGHSFGAYTTMLIGGVTVALGDHKNGNFFDERVKCILPISAQGTGQQGLTDKSWESLKLPMMTITGTRDRGVGGQGVEWRKEPYRFSPAGDKYLVVIDGANHFSFGGGLGARGSHITDIVKLCSTHFWDAYLKNVERAREYLQSDRLVQDAGGKCTFEKK